MVCPWSSMEPASVSFCEQRLCAVVAEPSNAWSSIAYVLVAFWLLSKPEARASRLLAAVAIAEMLIGIGSFVFHASGTFAGELVDLSGMFLLSGMMLALAIGHAKKLSPRQVAAAWALFTLGPLATVLVVKPAGIPLFALELVSAIVLELWVWRKKGTAAFNLFGQSLALVSTAFVIWAGDISGIACRPDNHLVTGHAVWHLLNAIAISRLFAFYAVRLAREGSLTVQVERPLSKLQSAP